jgi:pentatricopeptide repeat protein
MQSAVAVVGEMRALRIEPDVITYNALLDGWAKRGDVWEAADVMEQMQAAGVKPDVSSFCTLIYACMKVTGLTSSLRVLEF